MELIPRVTGRGNVSSSMQMSVDDSQKPIIHIYLMVLPQGLYLSLVIHTT